MGGIGIEEIAEDYTAFHTQAFDPLGLDADMTLDSVGSHKMQKRRRGTPVQSADHSYASAVHQMRAIMKCSKNILRMVDEEDEKINLRGQLDFNYPKKGRSTLKKWRVWILS